MYAEALLMYSEVRFTYSETHVTCSDVLITYSEASTYHVFRGWHGWARLVCVRSFMILRACLIGLALFVVVFPFVLRCLCVRSEISKKCRKHCYHH